jgi:hypothetical protein
VKLASFRNIPPELGVDIVGAVTHHTEAPARSPNRSRAVAMAFDEMSRTVAREKKRQV